MFTVLGSSGFIGGHLVQSLSDRGHSVMSPRRGELDHLPAHLGHAIYCIGVTSDFRTRPLEAVDAHVTVLTEMLRRHTFDSFLYLSSTRVYSGSDMTTEDAALIVRSSDASDLYNLTKLAGEAIVLSFSRPEYRIARVSNVVGIKKHSTDFLMSICSEALGGHLELGTALESAKDYVNVLEVVRLLEAIAVQGAQKIYNVAHGRNTTHAQLARELRTITGCRVTVAPGAQSVVFPEIDVTAISKEFGAPRTTVLEALPGLLRQLSKVL